MRKFFPIQDGGFVLGENVDILLTFYPFFLMNMDKPTIPLCTSISPSALDSFALSSVNQGEITDSSLFPYLDQMSELQAMENNVEDMPKPDLTARTLLDAAERVLMAEGGKLHVKDLEEKMVEYRLIPQSAKSLANLESILYRETFSENSKFKRIEGRLGWFALVGVDVDDMESDGSSSGEDQSESMDSHSINTPPRPKVVKPASHHDYRNKYYTLRKMVKELVFLNAAACDDITRTEAKLTRAKAERKFLLKRLFQYQAATEAGVIQPHGISTLPAEGPAPIMFPDVPLDRHKTQTKMKVKKSLTKGKEEKGNVVKGLGQHLKTKNALQMKLTHAKLAAQARNQAKIAGQQKASGSIKSAAVQNKSPSQNKTTAAEKEPAQVKTVTQAKQVVQTKSVQPPKTAIQLTEVPPIPGSKDKKADKPKTSRPKAKKPKMSESPQTTPVATNPPQAGESTKPKRKKPGTAIKRKVQPIPVDAKGKPVFPIVLGGLTVHSLGEIVWDRPGFHSERYIWPVGYCSSRTYPSIRDPEKKCLYTCKILDGGFGPQFEMCPEDDAEHPINASSATACHCVVLKTLNKARGRDASNTGSGPEFFGYSHPTIQYLIQNLPGAKKCNKYQWVKFELPKPQSKQGGKLTSACSLSVDNQDNQLSPQNEPRHSSSSQEGLGLGDDSTPMDQDDSNLTLQSTAIDDADDNIFENIGIPTSLRPLTLASSSATLSSQRIPSPLSPTSQLSGIGTDNDIDPDMGTLMSSPTSTNFSSSLPITLSPPSLTSPSSTATGNGSFVIPLTSPLFGSSSGFSSSVLPDLPK